MKSRDPAYQNNKQLCCSSQTRKYVVQGSSNKFIFTPYLYLLTSAISSVVINGGHRAIAAMTHLEEWLFSDLFG